MGLEAYPITWEEFESAPRPRVLKTHSPYHLLLGTNGNGVKALPSTTKVILMSRNPLDACVSSYYHAWNPFKSGWPFEAWASLWLNGYVPHGSWFDWVKGWYKESIDNSNQILWLQYEDLKINPVFQIEKIAKFLNINYNENLLELVAKASSFESMKEQAEALSDQIPVGHLRKGKSGDWKNHFSTKFYDESSDIWLKVWGENMHHGYYTQHTPKKTLTDHKIAQIDMIDQTISWAYNSQSNQSVRSITINNMVDVGCGVGGSSRHIARKFNCNGTGISLSPFQIEQANKLTIASALNDKLKFQVSDALAMPFANNTFDLTWSMESGEHMPNKKQFVNELYRVTTPGGRIIIVTWCHRELESNETSLKSNEIKLLKRISDAYYLPDWVASSTYVNLSKSLGLEDVRSADWSEFVEPFWPAVIKTALNPRNIIGLLRAGLTTIRGAIATLWMMRGFQKKLIKFVIITARKPLI
eukprot:gene20322-26379_t